MTTHLGHQDVVEMKYICPCHLTKTPERLKVTQNAQLEHFCKTKLITLNSVTVYYILYDNQPNTQNYKYGTQPAPSGGLVKYTNEKCKLYTAFA